MEVYFILPMDENRTHFTLNIMFVDTILTKLRIIKCFIHKWLAPTSRRIANLSEIFILPEVRKYMSYSDKTVIIFKISDKLIGNFY